MVLVSMAACTPAPPEADQAGEIIGSLPHASQSLPTDKSFVTTSAQKQTSEDEDEYHHPLQGLQPIDGAFPFLDLRTSPEGKAYAIGEEVLATEEGEEVQLLSGVIELEQRQMTAEEKGPKPGPIPQQSGVLPQLSATIQDLITSRPATDKIEIQVRAVMPERETISMRINRAIAAGLVDTQADWETARKVALAELRSDTANAIAPITAVIQELGGEILYPCQISPCLNARVAIGSIQNLADNPNVLRIDAIGDEGPQLQPAGGITGSEKAQVYQTRMFWDLGYDGDNGSGTDIHAAVLDVEKFLTNHVAFKEDTGSATRVVSCWDCSGGTCSQASPCWTSVTGTHGTQTLGAFLGDYRDGQDPSLGSTAIQEGRSAPGGEAMAYLYDTSVSSSGFNLAFDHAAQQTPAPHMFVTSDGMTPGDCNGTSAAAQSADDLYEAGVALFLAAGNSGAIGSAADCTIWSPGDAIGAFPVGGHYSDEVTLCDVREAGTHPVSSWGGATNDFDEGRFRSIVGISGGISADLIPTSSSTTAVGPYAGTSHAAPSVAGVAVDVIDMFKNYRGTDFIDDPGVLYAWMLNMGDRSDQLGAKMATKFDHRSGAGKINARFVGNPGMDAPWIFAHYELCVDHAQVQTLTIGGGSVLSSDIDSLRAVIWWYDRRLETQSTIDDIDLWLKKADGTTIDSSRDSYDNKERVYSNLIGGEAVKLEVQGYNVTSDVEGCGTNSMRVYVTLLIEDDSRDDVDGPDYSAFTCHGVQTL